MNVRASIYYGNAHMPLSRCRTARAEENGPDARTRSLPQVNNAR
jgi:hypothetical protein